jgi:predicted permease
MPNTFRSELRSAVRSLARTPSVAVSAVLCLTLGIGATAAIASAINRALLQPLPFRSPNDLVAAHRVTPQSGPQGTWPQSPANYVDLARMTKRIQSLSAITFGTALVDVGSETVQASELLVTGGLFDMLGARAERGRLLVPDDDKLDHPPVAVLSDELWRGKFGADPALVGRTVGIDGSPTTIVGILPPQFRIPQGGNVLRADVWVPTRFTPNQLGQRGNNSLFLLGRLAPGSTVQSADAELRGVFARLIETYPNLRGENMRVAPLQSENLQAIRKPLLLIFGAVCMVLLIAATNVAALLLARGVHRRREMAVRVALGASRWDAMRPVMAESVAITVVGTTLGLLLALAGVRTIGALAAARMPQLSGLQVDGRIIAFALVLALVVAVACGVAPAWRNATVDPQDALRGGRGGGTGRESHRALQSLVVGEIALSLVLLIGAGLETSHVLTLSVTTSSARYPNQTSVRAFLEPALAAISAVPDVEAAGAIQAAPYITWGWNSNIRYEGQPGNEPTRWPLVEQRSVTPGFFGVTKQRLISGRLLNAGDDDSPTARPVVVVNEALVKRDFKGADPVGRRFYATDTLFATIVGVVSDIRNSGPIAEPNPEMYWTYRQSSPGSSRFPIMIRTRGDPTSVTSAVRRAIQSVDRTAAVADVVTMPGVIAHSLGRPRFYFSLLGTFAAVAVLLSLAGLYGVLSYAVAQRMRELGIRVALGSSRGRLVRLVTGEGLRMVAIGVAVGLVASTGLTRLMISMLYGVNPLDRSTWALAALGMILSAMLATLLPSLRASRADPVVAMQAE